MGTQKGLEVLHEIREYGAVPGRFPALIEFFNEHTVPAFARCDMELVLAGTTWFGENSINELVYTMRFADIAELERKWKQLVTDPEWTAALGKAEAQAGGPLVASIKRRVLDSAAVGGA